MSEEEYLENRERIPVHSRDTWWRLRSKGHSDQIGCFIACRRRYLILNGARSDYFEDVRPTIRLAAELSKIPTCGKIRLLGHTWTAIDEDGHLLLCDENVEPNNEQVRYHLDYTDMNYEDPEECFERSDIRRWLECWYREQIKKYKKIQKKTEPEDTPADDTKDRILIAPKVYYYPKSKKIAGENPDDEAHSYSVSGKARQRFVKILTEAKEPMPQKEILERMKKKKTADSSGDDNYDINVSCVVNEMRKAMIDKGLERMTSKGTKGHKATYNTLRNDGSGYYFPSVIEAAEYDEETDEEVD
ncbi:MAG: hypothetical protein J5825_08785 [Lachnospiraceae bacterium]|nr:hypothetical protein [Lachnospiraceae bacterium]